MTATSALECASSLDGVDSGCSLWRLFRMCRSRRNDSRTGSEASLLKGSLSNSIAASKRTLTSHDGDATVLPNPLPQLLSASETDPTVRTDANCCDGKELNSPSYLKVSRCVGGYSTFTNYSTERLNSTHAPNKTDAAAAADVLHNGSLSASSEQKLAAVTGVTVKPSSDASCCVPKGGHPCRLTLVDDVVTSVSILPDAVNGQPSGCKSVYSNGVAEIEEPEALPVKDKDGRYFLHLVDVEQTRLQDLSNQTECHLLNSTCPVPEEADGKIRAAIGKANLLMTKKFRQFRELCNKSLNESGDEPFRTTVGDLEGFWDLVLLQIADVDRLFQELETLRQMGWKSDAVSNSKAHTAVEVSTRPTTSRSRSTPHHSRPNPAAAAKSSRSAMASRSREEARSQLMAAKKAGRQRKASDSENKDVEIFIF